jgi:hypothetical protein
MVVSGEPGDLPVPILMLPVSLFARLAGNELPPADWSVPLHTSKKTPGCERGFRATRNTVHSLDTAPVPELPWRLCWGAREWEIPRG